MYNSVSQSFRRHFERERQAASEQVAQHQVQRQGQGPSQPLHRPRLGQGPGRHL